MSEICGREGYKMIWRSIFTILTFIDLSGLHFLMLFANSCGKSIIPYMFTCRSGKKWYSFHQLCILQHTIFQIGYKCAVVRRELRLYIEIWVNMNINYLGSKEGRSVYFEPLRAYWLVQHHTSLLTSHRPEECSQRENRSIKYSVLARM